MIDLIKISLQEEIDRWIAFHQSHLREVQQYSVQLSNENISLNDYRNIELTSRHYGAMLIDELQLMGHIPTTTHTEDINNPLTISGPAMSISSNTSSHEEKIISGKPIKKVITLARPQEPKPTQTKTEFKINQK